MVSRADYENVAAKKNTGVAFLLEVAPAESNLLTRPLRQTIRAQVIYVAR